MYTKEYWNNVKNWAKMFSNLGVIARKRKFEINPFSGLGAILRKKTTIFKVQIKYHKKCVLKIELNSFSGLE